MGSKRRFEICTKHHQSRLLIHSCQFPSRIYGESYALSQNRNTRSGCNLIKIKYNIKRQNGEVGTQAHFRCVELLIAPTINRFEEMLA